VKKGKVNSRFFGMSYMGAKEARMRTLIALALLLGGSSGCIIEERHPYPHRRVAVVEAGHVHCLGCGHVQIGGVWYIE
jgi:hypothetical protein